MHTHAQPSGTHLCNYRHFFFLGIHLSCDGPSLQAKNEGEVRPLTTSEQPFSLSINTTLVLPRFLMALH